MATQTSSGFMTNFHPFGEKIASLHYRLQLLKDRNEALRICCEGDSFSKLNEKTQVRVSELFAIRDTEDPNDWFQAVAKRVVSIRPQIHATVLCLDALEKKIELQVHQMRELINCGNLNAAIQTLIEIENRFLHPAESIADNFLLIIQERLANRTYPELTAVDFLGTELFSQVLNETQLDQLTSSEEMPMAPIFYTSGQSVSDQRWKDAQTSLYREGHGIPVQLIGVARSTREQPWNLVRCYLGITRALYRELLLDTEVQSVFNYIAQSLGCTEQERQLLLTWRKEILCEMLSALCSGPAYLGSTVELHSHDANQVMYWSMKERGLPAYMRWEILAQTLRMNGFRSEADTYQAIIQGLYGPIEFASQFPQVDMTILSLVKKVPAITQILCETPLHVLGRRRLVSLFQPYDVSCHQEALALADKILKVAESGNPAASNGKKESSKKSAELFGLSADTTLSTVTAACRIAFERVSVQGEIPVELNQSCKRCLGEVAEKRLAASKKEKPALTAEQVHRLTRRSERTVLRTETAFVGAW